MPQDSATNGLIMTILLSVKQGENQLPNIAFVKNNDWQSVQNTSDNAPFGQGLFKKVGQAAYETARQKVTQAAPSDLSDDARVLTRSVERVTVTAAAPDPWGGSSAHPPNSQLASWVGALTA